MEEEKEIRKIKIHHAILTVIFIVVLFMPIAIIKYDIYRTNIEKDKEAKEEAITFLKENIIELEPLCNEIIKNKSSECTRWGYYYICYNNDSAVFNERGLTVAHWTLKYSNNNWYAVIGKNKDTVNITEYVK